MLALIEDAIPASYSARMQKLKSLQKLEALVEGRGQKCIYWNDSAVIPKIRINGEQYLVRQQAYKLVHNGYEYERLENICSDDICINPDHWAIKVRTERPKRPKRPKLDPLPPKSPQIKINREKPLIKIDGHIHSWEIDSPNGAESIGRCGCGEEKLFMNSMPDKDLDWKSANKRRFS